MGVEGFFIIIALDRNRGRSLYSDDSIIVRWAYRMQHRRHNRATITWLV